jgi:hypothetical protein
VKVARWWLAGHRGSEYSANLPTLRSPLPARWSRANGSQRKGRPLALRGWGGRGTGMGKSGNRGSNSHGDAGSRASNGQAAGSHGDAWGQGMSVLSTTEPDRRRDRVALGQRAPAMSDRTPEQRARKRGRLIHSVRLSAQRGRVVARGAGSRSGLKTTSAAGLGSSAASLPWFAPMQVYSAGGAATFASGPGRVEST